jgi:uncharacterized protein YaiL (DUF2058 family)
VPALIGINRVSTRRQLTWVVRIAAATLRHLPGDLQPMRNPLQEQLLKAGLVKKGQLAKVVHDQNKQRKAKGTAAAASEERIDATRLQAERAERDRALAAERNALARKQELQAQIRQIVETHKLRRSGEIDYRFSDGKAIRSVLVDATLRAQLAAGALVIVRHGEGYELLARTAAEKIYERDPAMVVLDHGRKADSAAAPEPDADSDEAYYRRFQVPDDLIW